MLFTGEIFHPGDDGLRCDWCGAKLQWVDLLDFDDEHGTHFKCSGPCRRLPVPVYPSYQCWQQTGQWRFGDHDYRAVAPPGPSNPYVFQLDTSRCDFCADRGTEAVWTGFPPPPNRNDAAIWLMACVPCRDRWEADHPEDVGFAKLTIKKEPPEFPVYVGWDGREHGEYWG